MKKLCSPILNIFSERLKAWAITFSTSASSFSFFDLLSSSARSIAISCFRRSSLPEIRVISFMRYLLSCGLSIIYRACSVGLDCQNKMARSPGRCERVDYVALNNLSSVDLEPPLKRQRKYKLGAKVYQVDRLISKRKSATAVSRNPNETVSSLCNFYTKRHAKYI